MPFTSEPPGELPDPLGELPPPLGNGKEWLLKLPDVVALKMYTKKRRRRNVVEKFREVSDTVWVSFEAVIIEKTLKED